MIFCFTYGFCIYLFVLVSLICTNVFVIYFACTWDFCMYLWVVNGIHEAWFVPVYLWLDMYILETCMYLWVVNGSHEAWFVPVYSALVTRQACTWDLDVPVSYQWYTHEAWFVPVYSDLTSMYLRLACTCELSMVLMKLDALQDLYMWSLYMWSLYIWESHMLSVKFANKDLMMFLHLRFPSTSSLHVLGTFSFFLIPNWCRFDEKLMQIWCRFGADLMQIWCRFGADLMQIWCRFDADLMQIWCRFDADLMQISNLHLICVQSASWWCTFDADLKSASNLHQICVKSASNLRQICIKFSWIFISKIL